MSKSKISNIRQHPRFPLMLKIGAAFVVLFIIIALVAESGDGRKSVSLDMDKILSDEAKAVAETKPVHVDENVPLYSYQIQDGDNLSSIFVRLGVPYGDMLSVMDTDQNHLTLDTLRPGDILKIWMDENQEHLTKLEVEFTLADKVVLLVMMMRVILLMKSTCRVSGNPIRCLVKFTEAFQRQCINMAYRALKPHKLLNF